MYGRHPWWEDGEYATCQCGAEVIVDVEDGIASLELRGEAPPVWTAADIAEMDATAEGLSAAFAAEDESPPFDLTERAGFQSGFVRMNRYSAEASKILPLKPSKLERFEQREFHRSDRHFKEVE